MQDVDFKDNGDGTYTFTVEGGPNDMLAILESEHYEESMVLHQSVYTGGRHTVVLKDRPLEDSAATKKMSDELREYAKKHLPAHMVQAGRRGPMHFGNGLEHPDIFQAKLRGAGINLGDDAE